MDQNQIAQDVQTLARVWEEIGIWSGDNFGKQTSKIAGFDMEEMAPLLGIVEEYFEGEVAHIVNANGEEFEDAVADVLVYLCDYCWRSKKRWGNSYFHLPSLYFSAMSRVQSWRRGERRQPFICKGLNGLFHSFLKAHQGIRGFTNTQKFLDAQNEAISELLAGLYTMSKSYVGRSMIDILEDTWNKVKERNWKKNPENAHEVAEVKTPDEVISVEADLRKMKQEVFTHWTCPTCSHEQIDNRDCDADVLVCQGCGQHVQIVT